MSAGDEGATKTLADCCADCVAVEPSYGRLLGQFQGINFRCLETFFGPGRALTVIARSESDEAIYAFSLAELWIASLRSQ
jgi:hypothetical protein